MKLEDVNITQKSVNDFLDNIDTDALADSIRLSFSSKKGVSDVDVYQEYLKTKENIEGITADLEMTDEMVNRARANLLHEFERTCQAIRCYEDSVGLQQNYIQRSYAYEDALEQLELHIGALNTLREAINRVGWKEEYGDYGVVKYVPIH